MAIDAVVPVAFVIIAAWFWRHCARPCLLAAGARRPAMNLVLGVTLLAMVVYLVDAVTQITNRQGLITFWLALVGSVAWILIVAVGYLNEYRALIRFTGGPDFSGRRASG
jgi:tellurite resistance protein TehA-like permease